MQRQVRLVTVIATVVAALGGGLARAEAPRVEAPRAEVEAKAWRVRATVVGPVLVGKPARLEVTLEARPPYHLNDDYPVNLKTAAASGLRFDKPRIDKADGIVVTPCASEAAHACRALVPAAFTLTADARVGGVLAFSACDANQCIIEKIAVSAPVVVGK